MTIPSLPTGSKIAEANGWLTETWLNFFQALYNVVRPIGSNGNTAARPIHNPARGSTLYVGQQYFDTTLGYPVYVSSLNPTVWVNGAGAVV